MGLDLRYKNVREDAGNAMIVALLVLFLLTSLGITYVAVTKGDKQIAGNQMTAAQANLDSIEVEGAAGGGLVKVRASAKGRVIAVAIDDSLMALSEKQMLEDLIAAAFNDARNKADAVSSDEMGKMTAGMQLPPGFKLPF